MDEQELRKIISEVLQENPTVMYIPDLAPYLLKKIDNEGYRKIPEGAVVISKEEYDELKHRPSMRELVDTCRGRIEQTASDIIGLQCYKKLLKNTAWR